MTANNKVVQLQQLDSLFEKLTDPAYSGDLALLKNQIAQIQSLVKALPADLALNHQFLDIEAVTQMANIIENITVLRTKAGAFRKKIFESGLWIACNQIVNQFKQALYQHESMQEMKALTYPMPNEKSAESLMAWAEAATQRASEASAAAEKATYQGAMTLEKMQKQLNKDSLIEPDLIGEINKQNQITFIKNTLAVIAADEAAATLVEVEEWLNNNK